MVISPGPFCADIAADYCWRKFLRGQTEMPNESDANSCGKQERFTISLEEFWLGSTLGNKAEKRKPCSRRPKNNVVKEPAFKSQEIKQQSHERTRWREQPQARQNTLKAPDYIPDSPGTHPTDVERDQAARAGWCGGRYKAARSATREQGRSKTGIAALTPSQIGTLR